MQWIFGILRNITRYYFEEIFSKWYQAALGQTSLSSGTRRPVRRLSLVALDSSAANNFQRGVYH